MLVYVEIEGLEEGDMIDFDPELDIDVELEIDDDAYDEPDDEMIDDETEWFDDDEMEEEYQIPEPLNAGPGDGLVQFELHPVGTLPSDVTQAQARAALMNTTTVTHPLFANATTTAAATAINGGFGRDALFLGASADGNRYRVLIAGFEGYVNRTGATTYNVTVNINGQNHQLTVRANAVFVPFGHDGTARHFPAAIETNLPEMLFSYQTLEYTSEDFEAESRIGTSAHNEATVQSLSHYVNRNGELWRILTNNVNTPTGGAQFLTGSAPSWMSQDTRYYSFDGVYFYRNPRNIRVDGSGAVNANNPHFNYFQYLSFRSASHVTSTQLNNFLHTELGTEANRTDSVLTGQGQYFINAQNRYGINALLQYSKAMHESGRGLSEIARNNNNVFGLNAIDAAPGQNASVFPSVAASINDHANGWMSRGYLWPGDWRYEGPHAGHKGSGMNVRYATDPYWGQKIAGWAFRIDRTLNHQDRNREQIVIRQNRASVAVTDVEGTMLYTANPRQNRYFPFLVGGMSEDRLRVVTDPAIVNGVPNRTALFNRNNAIGFIPNSNVWLTGSGNTAIVPPAIEVSPQAASTTAALDLRRGPGTEHAIITTLPNGTNVTILGTNADGSWSFIRVQNQEGWVREFLSVLINPPTTIQAAAHTRLAVTTTNSPFRFGPGTRYDTIRTVPIYTNVEITGRHGDWRRVMVNNQIGWIHSNRLTYRTRLGRITQNTVLRSSANANGAVIRDLPSGSDLVIMGVSHDRNWRRVRVGNQTGWISSPHITTRNDSGRTTLSGWLRPGPRASSGEIRYVNRNTSITILGESGNWTQVRVGNQAGWIATGRVTTN